MGDEPTPDAARPRPGDGLKGRPYPPGSVRSESEGAGTSADHGSVAHVIGQVARALEALGEDMDGRRVYLVGLGFAADPDSPPGAQALDLRRRFEQAASEAGLHRGAAMILDAVPMPDAAPGAPERRAGVVGYGARCQCGTLIEAETAEHAARLLVDHLQAEHDKNLTPGEAARAEARLAADLKAAARKEARRAH